MIYIYIRLMIQLTDRSFDRPRHECTTVDRTTKLSIDSNIHVHLHKATQNDTLYI